MPQSRFPRFSRRGAVISIAGALLVLLSLFLPFAEYTVYNRTINTGPFIQSLQSTLVDFMRGNVIQNLETIGRDGIFFLAAPYLVASIILLLSYFALFLPLNRFFRGLYLLLFIVGGLTFSPFLLLILIGAPRLGFLGVLAGFICMYVGYRNIIKTIVTPPLPQGEEYSLPEH